MRAVEIGMAMSSRVLQETLLTPARRTDFEQGRIRPHQGQFQCGGGALALEALAQNLLALGFRDGYS